MPPRSSQVALRNLLIVLVITVGALIYAYGWTVTDIDLSKPSEPSRQTALTNSLREMLSPRVFEQDRELVSATAAALYDCSTGDVPAEVELLTDQPSVTISPTCGQPGDLITVRATGFAPEADAQIRWVPESGQSRPRDVVGTGEDLIILDASGSFVGQIEVPRLVGATGQIHQVEFRASTPTGPVRLSDTANEVVRRMTETIFMALVATTLAIPISVLISFFAAHNLMRNIRMPVGHAMLLVIVLPLGYVLGTLILGLIGQYAFNLARGEPFDASTLATIPLTFALGATVMARQLGLGKETISERVVGAGQRLLAALIVVAALGLLGGLGITVERILAGVAEGIRPDEVANVFQWLINAMADGINGVGTMFGVIGGVIGAALMPVSGIVGGIALATSAVTLARPILRDLSSPMDTAAGTIMGGLSGAFLMIAVGYIGMSAALFGLFPALVSGLLGSAVASGILRWMLRDKPIYEKTQLEHSVRWVIRMVGFALGFLLAFVWLNVGRSLVIGVLPSTEATGFLGLPTYLVQCGIIGLVLGGIAGTLSGVKSAFGIGGVFYNVSREILNALRSIEPLIMAIIFVIWVGIGPFAGVLALMLHSIASLGKLYSEQIETIDSGPVEALQSTGANHLQTIIYAVVPQIVPPYIAFTMYRWDINVRMSTIIGFVGGGGIGLLLNQQINLLRYRDAGVAVLAIAVVVSALDYASAKIRESIL